MALFGRPTQPATRLDELKKIVGKDPASRQFLALAEEHRRAGSLKDSLDTLRRGLQFNPGHVGGLVSLGRTLAQAGQPEDAIGAFQDALRLDPQNLVAIRQLGELYRIRGEHVEAIKKLKLYRGLVPGDREVNDAISQLEGLIRSEASLPSHIAEDLGSERDEDAYGTSAGEAVPGTAPEVLPYSEGSGVHREAMGSAATRAAELLGGSVPGSAGEADDGPDRSAAAGPDGIAPAAEIPIVTETLADLYRDQGYLDDARRSYEALADVERDPDRAAALKRKAEQLDVDRGGETNAAAAVTTVQTRPGLDLTRWLAALGARSPTRAAIGIEDLGTVLRDARSRTRGLLALSLCDLEGLPVVAVGTKVPFEVEEPGPSREFLFAELTTFWKSVDRGRDDLGGGRLESLRVVSSRGTTAVAEVNPNYILLLLADPDVPPGQIQYIAEATAERLRPALPS